jgi:hypothetical protein
LAVEEVMEAYEAARTLTMDQAALVTMGGHEGDGRPIPLMNIASARYGSRTVSSSRSGWLNNTMLSLVPWMESSGLRIPGATSTLGKRSPGRVRTLLRTIR